MRKAWRVWTSVSKVWLFHRLGYELKRRSGWIERRYPSSDYLKTRASWAKAPMHFPDALVPVEAVRDCLKLFHAHVGDVILKAEALLTLKIPYFSHYVHSFEGEINWFYNPFLDKTDTRRGYWTTLENLDGKGNDSKVYWELSRFCWMIPVVQAYVVTQDKRYADFASMQLSDWIDKNPYLETIQWTCGQEIAMRVMNWSYLLSVMKSSFSKEVLEKIERNIYFSAKRIESNIGYAIHCVRNNHSLSESAALYTVGVLFPYFKESTRWKKQGAKIFAKELSWQVMDDGGYVQHSFNYQRLVCQLVLWMLKIEEFSSVKLPKTVRQKGLDLGLFLASFLQDSGRVSNFGANDGAILFPFSTAPYTSFSPTIHALLVKLTGLGLSQSPEVIDEALWWGLSIVSVDKSVLAPQDFSKSGFVQLGEGLNRGFLRTEVLTKRTVQSDMLTLDLWVNGHNLICDLGTFSYNSVDPSSFSFFTSLNHNTLSINGQDHLEHIGRFLWIGIPHTNHISHRVDSEVETSVTQVTLACGAVLTRQIWFHRTKHLWVIADLVSDLHPGSFWDINWNIDGTLIPTNDPLLYRVQYPQGVARIWSSDLLKPDSFWKANYYLKKDPICQLKGRFFERKLFFTVIDPDDRITNIINCKDHLKIEDWTLPISAILLEFNRV